MSNKILHIISVLLIIVATAFPLQVAAQKKSTKTTTKKTATKTPKLSAKELKEKASEAFSDYRFDEARKYNEEYWKVTPSEECYQCEENFNAACDAGLNMLQRVENIAIIDSFTVDKKRFFEAYRLSAPSGRIIPGDQLPKELSEKRPAGETVFVSENGDLLVWNSTDEAGESGNIFASHLLTDGTWEEPKALLSESIVYDAHDGGSSDFPYLMPDGTTLYFAKDDGTTGWGYDIFVTRDNGNGFLEPQNIGMPYNSPYDDYMLAIDEVTGAGWWATDRNQIPDKVTIYVFVPQELRINYPVDAPDLINRAKITTIAGTGASTENNERVLAAINSLKDTPKSAKSDFIFALPGGRIITRFSQLSNPAAVEAMKQYLDAQFELDRAIERLDDMRERYSTDRSLGNKILAAEREIDRMRVNIRRLSNNVVKADSRR